MCAGLGSWCCSSAVCWTLVGWGSSGGSGWGSLSSGFWGPGPFVFRVPGSWDGWDFFMGGLRLSIFVGLGALVIAVRKTCKYFQICLIGYILITAQK